MQSWTSRPLVAENLGFRFLKLQKLSAPLNLSLKPQYLGSFDILLIDFKWIFTLDLSNKGSI